MAKSCVIFDVKPYDSDTDMKELEEKVRALKVDGLIWGEGKLESVAFGIMKLQIACVVEDDKVSVDDLITDIETELEDMVQSVDIVSFNKL